MASSKQRQWLLQEIKLWQDKALVDQETAHRLQAYYSQEDAADQGPSLLSYALVLLGTALVLLGIILILAKNWSAMPRLARVFCSMLPLLTGIGLGAFSLAKEKDRRWSEAATLIMAVGILTALAINGQIYHVISNPSHLFLFSALLSLPLIYIFSAEITALFYLIMVSIYFGIVSSQYTLQIGYFFLVGLFLIGLIKPWILWQIYKGKVTGQSFWILFALAITGFVFITGLMIYDVPVREIYALYFFSIILLNDFLFPNQRADSQSKQSTLSLWIPESPLAVQQLHTLDLLGKFGLYVLIYVLSFNGLWSHISGPSIQQPMHLAILMIFFAAMIGLWLFLFKRDGRKDVLSIFLPMIIGLFHVLAEHPSVSVIAALVFNLLFFVMGLYYLFQGIRENRLAIANHGLLFIVLLVATRFLDIEFSFLVRGIVFMILGAGFLITNLWLVRKKKEVHHV